MSEEKPEVPIEELPKEVSVNSPDTATASKEQITQSNQPINSDTPKLPAASNEENLKHEKSYTLRENIKFFAEILGIVGGLIGLVLLYGQYKEMVKATNATKDAVVVAQNQMREMKRQTDDSEAQQRALLKFGPVGTTITTNYFTNEVNSAIAQYYNLTFDVPIKNVGFTPAVELQGAGTSFPENDLTRSIEEVAKNNTNVLFLKRWDRKHIPTPSPYNGDPFTGGTAVTIQPGETITNSFFNYQEFRGGTYYFEQWISYRDVFKHSWIIGEGGHYDFTNNLFVLEFLYSQKYRQDGDTNYETAAFRN